MTRLNYTPLVIALGLATLFLALIGLVRLDAGVVYEKMSPYHNVRVIDAGGFRTLSFDGSTETRMSLADPLQGHFEYTEHFHLAWLWNTNVRRILMIGLGGGSAQKSFLHDYPEVRIDSIEIDPVVLGVATNFFHVPLNERHRVHISDGRMFLRRSRVTYDLIIVDAYVKHRYGSEIPPHLVTREFIELARDRLSSHGVLVYNIIGTLRGWKSGIVTAVARTLYEGFPFVYYAPASTSQNVVLFGTRARQPDTSIAFQKRANNLIRSRTVQLPTFPARLSALRAAPPPTEFGVPALTDDHAPVESLAR